MQAIVRSPRNGYIVYLLGACFFMIFGLYNSYPIISGDSAAYINNAFNQLVPDDRPIFYGLFLRVASAGTSLWLAVFFQSLLLSYVLVNFIRGLAPQISMLRLLGLLLLIATGTVAGWYAGQIMPDIFTSILFLAIANFLLFPKSRWTDAVLVGTIYLCIIMHLSHYMISTLLGVLILVGSVISRAIRPVRHRAIVLLSISAISWLTLFTSNYIGGKGFVSSNSSHVFLMGKLAESGVLKTYLDKACPIKGYKICAFKDSLPPAAWEFVWGEHSAVNATGGWAANKEEYNTIIRDIASRPKYWPYIAYKSVEATARQLVQPNIDESAQATFKKGDFTYWSIEWNYQHEVKEFIASRQNRKQIDFGFFDHLFTVVLVLSSVICLFAISSQLKQEAKPVYFLLIAFLIINAFVTATFANVLSRLNSRDLWLLPAVNFVFIYKSVVRYFLRSSAEVIEG